MSDSYEKLIAEIKVRRGELTGLPGAEREVMGLNYIIGELEALQKAQNARNSRPFVIIDQTVLWLVHKDDKDIVVQMVDTHAIPVPANWLLAISELKEVNPK